MTEGFDPQILAKFDLSAWVAVAFRQRAWIAEAGPRRWITIEGSPMSEAEARSGRIAGYLLTALRCDQDAEVLLVKLTEQAREALAKPTLPRRGGRKRPWYD
jgi:hypothetical protein